MQKLADIKKRHLKSLGTLIVSTGAFLLQACATEMPKWHDYHAKAYKDANTLEKFGLSALSVAKFLPTGTSKQDRRTMTAAKFNTKEAIASLNSGRINNQAVAYYKGQKTQSSPSAYYVNRTNPYYQGPTSGSATNIQTADNSRGKTRATTTKFTYKVAEFGAANQKRAKIANYRPTASSPSNMTAKSQPVELKNAVAQNTSTGSIKRPSLAIDLD